MRCTGCTKINIFLEIEKITTKTTLQSIKQPYLNKKFKQFWCKIIFKQLMLFQFVNPVPFSEKKLISKHGYARTLRKQPYHNNFCYQNRSTVSRVLG